MPTMATMSNGPIKVESHAHHTSFVTDLKHSILSLAEDSYDGSGSGGGSGFEEDDDTGSGLGPWVDEPTVPDSPTGSGAEGKSGGSSSSGGSVEFDSTSHKTVTVVVSGAGGSSSGTSSTTGSGSSRVPPMSITRALLQFFLPLVMAWFGGLFADLL